MEEVTAISTRGIDTVIMKEAKISWSLFFILMLMVVNSLNILPEVNIGPKVNLVDFAIVLSVYILTIIGLTKHKGPQILQSIYVLLPLVWAFIIGIAKGTPLFGDGTGGSVVGTLRYIIYLPLGIIFANQYINLRFRGYFLIRNSIEIYGGVLIIIYFGTVLTWKMTGIIPSWMRGITTDWGLPQVRVSESLLLFITGGNLFRQILLRRSEEKSIRVVIKTISLLLCIAITFARYQYFALLLTILVALWISHKIKMRLLFIILVIGLVLIPLIPSVIDMPTTMGQNIIKNFLDIFDPKTYTEDASVSWRLFEIKYAFKAISTSPVFGIGLGTDYRPSLGNLELRALGHEGILTYYIHNGIIWYMVDTGILGTIMGASLVLPAIRYGLRVCLGATKEYSVELFVSEKVYFFGGLIALLIGSMAAPLFMGDMESSFLLGISLAILSRGTRRGYFA